MFPLPSEQQMKPSGANLVGMSGSRRGGARRAGACHSGRRRPCACQARELMTNYVIIMTGAPLQTEANLFIAFDETTTTTTTWGADKMHKLELSYSTNKTGEWAKTTTSLPALPNRKIIVQWMLASR